LLRSDKDVGDVFVLAEKRDVEEDLQGLGISSENNELGLTSVEGLGGLVGALSHLREGYLNSETGLLTNRSFCQI
jgi:hypothetical protein